MESADAWPGKTNNRIKSEIQDQMGRGLVPPWVSRQRKDCEKETRLVGKGEAFPHFRGKGMLHADPKSERIYRQLMKWVL